MLSDKQKEDIWVWIMMLSVSAVLYSLVWLGIRNREEQKKQKKIEYELTISTIDDPLPE